MIYGSVLQLQKLIQLMLESLSSLLGSLISITQTGKSPEGHTHTIDDLIPSLCKIRKLAGKTPKLESTTFLFGMSLVNGPLSFSEHKCTKMNF